MVEQGDIININFNPVKGHEQKGFRPALVISNDTYNQRCGGFAIVCPITRTDNKFPLHVELKNGETKGYVLCEHIRYLDVKSRGYTFVEKASIEVFDMVINIVRNCF